MLENFKSENFNERFDFDSNLIENLEKKTSDNIVCYNGFSPFIGRGVDVGAWSFVVDIDRGSIKFDKTSKPEKFEIDELYKIFDESILSLKIENLTLDDKIFISGDKIRNDRFFLPKINRFPINKVSDVDFDIIAKNESSLIRRYKVITVAAWGGDLVFSNFIRFQKSDSSLFIESNSFLLPPVEDSYREIDYLRSMTGIREPIFWFWLNTLKTPFILLYSLIKVLSYIHDWIKNFIGFEKREIEKKVLRSTKFNYGATTSIRQIVGQYNYQQHFQRLDKEMHQKIIEKRIFNCLCDFLESKGIDTSDFKERESNIINSGVMVTGGNVSTGNMAVGKKSKLNFSFNNKKQNESKS